MVQRITVRHMVVKSKTVATGTTGKDFFLSQPEVSFDATLSQ